MVSPKHPLEGATMGLCTTGLLPRPAALVVPNVAVRGGAFVEHRADLTQLHVAEPVRAAQQHRVLCDVAVVAHAEDEPAACSERPWSHGIWRTTAQMQLRTWTIERATRRAQRALQPCAHNVQQNAARRTALMRV